MGFKKFIHSMVFSQLNLSRKLIRLVFLTVVVSSIVIATTVSLVTLTRFNLIEDRELSANISRLNDAVSARLESLSSKNGDWSNWDDAYNYVLGNKADFVDSNVTDNAFVQLNISGMYFFDTSNQVVLGKFVDPATQKEQPTPAGFGNYIAQSQLLNFSTSQNNTGIIEFNRQDYLFSVRPVLTSDGNGPATGSLIFLRLLDSKLVSQLSATVHLDVSLYRYADPALPAEISEIKNTISPTVQPQRHLGPNLTAGYSLVNDAASGQPIIIWRVSMPRSAYALGRQTVILFIIYFTIIAVVAGLILVWLLRRIILNRLQGYRLALEKIRTTGDLDTRVVVTGHDEISVVGDTINEFLSRLKSSLVALSIERDKASTILQSMGEGLIVLDKDLKIIAINPAAEGLLDVVASTVIGQLWTDTVNVYINDKRISFKDRSVVRVIEGGEPIYVKIEDGHYFETHTGKKFPVISTTTPFRGAVSGAVIVFRDATQEKNIRQKIETEVDDRTKALDEVKARLIASINSLSVGYLMINPGLGVELINQSALDMFHRQHGGDHDPTSDLVTIQTLGAALGRDIGKEITNVLTKQQPVSLEKLPFGTLVVNVAISPIIERKAIIGAVVLLEDVTAEILLERSKDEFFSIASHELRTPLTAIQGNAALIRDYYKEALKNKDLAEMIEDISQSSKRLIGIVNDYLNVSRLEQGRIKFVSETFDLAAVVKKAVAEEQAAAVEKKLQLTNTVTAPTSVVADSSRTEEVLINLISNAVKYTDAGTVTISVEITKAAVKVSISDTGRGIPTENQRSLFHKFQQAANNLYVRDPSKSTGLGLYISKLLVEGMGGNITCERSEIGKGTTFSFTLPIQAPKTAVKTNEKLQPKSKNG